MFAFILGCVTIIREANIIRNAKETNGDDVEHESERTANLGPGTFFSVFSLV